VTRITSRRRDYSLGDVHGLEVHLLGSRTMLVSRSLLNPSSRTICAKSVDPFSLRLDVFLGVSFSLGKNTLLVTCDVNNIKTTRLLFRWHTWARSTPVGLSIHASFEVAAKILDVHHVCKVRRLCEPGVAKIPTPHQVSTRHPVGDFARE